MGTGTGDTVVSLPISSPPPQVLDQSPSNLSSPLSDVEDKDADADDIGLGDRNRNSSSLSNVNLEDDEASGRGSRSVSAGDEDDDSNLSEVDVHDSEAETERLYDTPEKNHSLRDAAASSPESGGKPANPYRDRAFEPSPSKLKQQVPAAADHEHDDGDDSLSDDEGGEEEDDDSSETEPRVPPIHAFQSQSPSESKKALADTQRSNRGAKSDTRKRKRSLVADNSESDQPLRKRLGSVAASEREGIIGATAADEDGEAVSTNTLSGELSGAEDNGGKSAKAEKDKAADSVETATGEGVRPRNSKRNGTRSRGGPGEEGGDEELGDDAADDAGAVTPEDEAGAQADDGRDEADADGAEAAHKNEEECRRNTPIRPTGVTV